MQRNGVEISCVSDFHNGRTVLGNRSLRDGLRGKSCVSLCHCRSCTRTVECLRVSFHKRVAVIVQILLIVLDCISVTVGYRIGKGCGFRNLAFRVGHGCGCVGYCTCRREVREHCLGNLYAFGFAVIVGYRDVERYERTAYHVDLILRCGRNADRFHLAFCPNSFKSHIKPSGIVIVCYQFIN